MASFESMVEGAELPAKTLPAVEQIQVVKYAGASGDFNPIHTIPAFAAQAGLPSTIAHGMMSMGFLGSYVTEWLGYDARLLKFGVRFAAMTFPGDVLTLSGCITKKYHEGTEARADVDLAVHRQDGSVTTKGWATVAWPLVSPGV